LVAVNAQKQAISSYLQRNRVASGPWIVIE
jgi:hypothetical protein